MEAAEALNTNGIGSGGNSTAAGLTNSLTIQLSSSL